MVLFCFVQAMLSLPCYVKGFLTRATAGHANRLKERVLHCWAKVKQLLLHTLLKSILPLLCLVGMNWHQMAPVCLVSSTKVLFCHSWDSQKSERPEASRELCHTV